MEKTATIEKSAYSNEWQNPSGGLTYYYDVVLSNGDAGTIGVTDKNSPKVQKGSKITYTINGNKIKVTQMENERPQQSQNSGFARKGKMSHDAFLGYAWSYAKDLVIAGKGMNDVEELNKVARYIYDEIGKMLNNDSSE